MARRSALLLPIALTACASAGDDYPSLALRPEERPGGIAPVAIAPPLVAPSPTDLARVRTVADAARAAHGGFVDALPRARAAVRRAAGSAVGSKAWADAKVALADLESHRSETAIHLGDLDAALVAAAIVPVDPAPIAAIRADVVSLIETEDAALATLYAAL